MYICPIMPGLYIHIPYCTSKCPYCNFYSIASRRNICELRLALIQEMQLQKHYFSSAVLNTIYFGGGTPSILPVEDIGSLIQSARDVFNADSTLEITLEANPEHINPDYLSALADVGVNRISVGLQALFDEPLLELGRSHNAEKALRALTYIADSSIKEISADLIYGVSQLSDEMLLSEIKTLISLRVAHISAYALTVEEHTALHQMIAKGRRSAVSEEQCVRQYLLLIDALEQAGYEHYEISNFCLRGHRSQHNSAYWQGVSYLGIGPSAHSYNGNSRQWNVSNISKYFSSINNGIIPCESEELTPIQKFNEMIMTRIRTSSGLNLAEVESQFGKDSTKPLRKAMIELLMRGWIEQDCDNIRLSKSGKLHADGIAAELFINP